MSSLQHHPASFKDPSGFVFKKDNLLYRQVNKSYAEDYDLLMTSGLYKDLVGKKYLLNHSETTENFSGSADWYKTILPEQLSFTSYFYEWCFGQLKDAALLTLAVQKMAIKYGMVLKDATPSNVQFHKGRPVLIDTLSFEKYDQSQPWIAYRQFCECFLFPLYLQKYLGIDLQKLMLAWPDGIPATVTKKMLPLKSNFNLGVGLHVSLQSKIKTSKNPVNYRGKFNQEKMLQLVANLEDNIKVCILKKDKTTWSNYYAETIISQSYLSKKADIFHELINAASFKTVLDIGANDGFFSKLIAEKAKMVVAIDFDVNCINSLYDHTRKQKITNILPLCIDIANPTPASGFNNTERSSFLHRSHFDMVLALALVHHLAIGKNIPLQNIAASFKAIATTLIIEFISKEDEKVKQLLQHRKDIFSNYAEAGFEEAFGEYFNIIAKTNIPGTYRIMYLLKRKDDQPD
ncbi:MAG: class I SAM-dependent methyltransferase [Ginsengibacter sp.]